MVFESASRRLVSVSRWFHVGFVSVPRQSCVKSRVGLVSVLLCQSRVGLVSVSRRSRVGLVSVSRRSRVGLVSVLCWSCVGLVTLTHAPNSASYRIALCCRTALLPQYRWHCQGHLNINWSITNLLYLKRPPYSPTGGYRESWESTYFKIWDAENLPTMRRCSCRQNPAKLYEPHANLPFHGRIDSEK